MVYNNYLLCIRQIIDFSHDCTDVNKLSCCCGIIASFIIFVLLNLTEKYIYIIFFHIQDTQGFWTIKTSRIQDVNGWSNSEFVSFSVIISRKTWNIAIKWSKYTSGITLKIMKKYRGLCCSQISKQSVKPDISPLVSQLGGQVGHQKKQNSSRNWLLIILCATFQPKLSKLSKTTQNGHFLALFWTFLKIVQFWLKSSARNQEKSIPWRILLLLMPHLTPNMRD